MIKIRWRNTEKYKRPRWYCCVDRKLQCFQPNLETRLRKPVQTNRFLVDEQQMRKQDPKCASIHPSRIRKEDLVKRYINRMKPSYERLLLEIYSGRVCFDCWLQMSCSCCLALFKYIQNLEKRKHDNKYLRYIFVEPASINICKCQGLPQHSMAVCNSGFWTMAFNTQLPLY